MQRAALDGHAIALAARAHRQASVAVQSVDPLVVGGPALPLQEDVQPSVAVHRLRRFSYCWPITSKYRTVRKHQHGNSRSLIRLTTHWTLRIVLRSEVRRVGKECVSTCRSR